MHALRHLLFAVSLTFASVTPYARGEDYNPVADPKAMVQSGNARFTVLTPGVIRMEYSPDGQFEDRASYVVVNRKLPVPSFRTGEAGSCSSLPFSWPAERTKKAIGIGTDRIALAFFNDGKPFTKDNLLICTPKPASGADVVWELSPPFASKNNLGGTVRTLDGVNGSIPLPNGILSRDGWYCLDDSNSLLFDDSPDPWIRPRNKPGYIDWYFMSYGHDYKQALKDYISIAGRIPMPPRFAFGTWWSRYWDYTDAELRQLVKEFKEHDVPLDVLVIDMGWHLDGWTGYTWNPKCFPDPDGFLKWVHEQGLKTTLNLHPAEGVGKQEKAFPQVCAAMGLDPKVTDRVPFDCTSREYMDAYFKFLHHPLEAQGIDFWWMDWQQGTNTNITGLDPLPWLNYLHWHDMEKRAAQTGNRPLLFSRWGGLGNHRYQIGFSGDTFSTWQSLAFQPYFTATAGNVGYAYWSHDIGGHMPGKVDPELYTRWIQWGALSPILRTHTTKNPEAERRIWAYPPEYFDAMKKAFELRYELIPYIYTAARQCYDTGLPICRPLYYEWPDLDEAYTHPGEYMFGDQMLAAPVTEPSDPISKCAMVEVWLPPGKWTNWFTGRTYDGPKTVPFVVPLDEIPLFVKDGGMVVTQPEKMRSDEVADPLIINSFPAPPSQTTLYEDDGRSVRYLHEPQKWTTIANRIDNKGQAITIEPSKKATPVERHFEIRLFDIPRLATNVFVNGVQLEGTMTRPGEYEPSYFYYGDIMGIDIRLPALPATRKIDIELRRDENSKLGFNYPGHTRQLFRQWLRLCKNLKIDDVGTGTVDDIQLGAFYWLTNYNMEYPLKLAKNWLNELEKLKQSKSSQLSVLKFDTRSLVQYLGLFYKMTISPDKDAKGSLKATVHLQGTLPIPALETLQGDIRFVADSSIAVRDPLQKAVNGITENNPVVLNAAIQMGQTSSTVSVHAEISLKNDQIELHIPLEQVVLPSFNAWYILGPFENPFVEGLKRQFPPDTKVDLAAEYEGKGGKKIKWTKFERKIRPGDDLTAEFFVDCDDVFGQRVYECVVYGFTYLEAPEDMDAVLALGTDDGCSVTLNGKEVHRVEGGRAYISKQDRVLVRLKKGQNTLLLKVYQGGGDAGWCVHVEDKDGKPLTQVKPHL